MTKEITAVSFTEDQRSLLSGALKEAGDYLRRMLTFASPSTPAPPFRFCPRCGKDLKDMPIHTCTPPREKGGA